MPFLTGSAQAKAAKQAAQIQANADQKGLDLQKQIFDTTRNDLAPYRDVGAPALSLYGDSYGLNGEAGKANALTAFRDYNPGYDYALSQGVRANDMGAAARGELGTGGHKADLTTLGQGLADQNYGNWQAGIGDIAKLGEGAATQTGQFGANYAGSASNLLSQQGGALANGVTQAAAAKAQGVNNLLGLAGLAVGGLAPGAGGTGTTWYGWKM